MKNKIILYTIRMIEITTLFIIVKSILEFSINSKIIDSLNKTLNFNFILILVLLVTLYILIHLIRMFRIYILLVEEGKKVKDFIKIYLKSTFVNNILPFKLGEIYIILSFGRALKNIKNGVILTLLNRFFDALILLSMLFINLLIYGQYGDYKVYIFLFLFIFIVTIMYISFESTFKYFNKLILTRSKRNIGVTYLKILDNCKEMFNDVKNMVRGRGIILLSLSALIWFLEYNFVKLIFIIFNANFSYNEFIWYINNAFFGIYNNINITSFTNVVLLFISIFFVYVLSSFRKGGNK
jgi:hypothetical protein